MDETPEKPGPGVYVFGIASAAAGILDLLWGNFEPAHQPIQAFGDHIPGQTIFAYIVGLCLVGGGLGILFRRTAQAAAAALGLVHLLFGVFWLPRFYTASQALGFRIPVLIGIAAGVAQQLILAAAALLVYSTPTGSPASWDPKTHHAVRWTFGLSSIFFGLAHFTGVRGVASMVPTWIPLGGDFWAVLTGIAFVLAGIAILSGVLDVSAARLLGLMLLLFSALVLASHPFSSPRNHVAWGGNAYNLAAVGAAWILADSIARRRLQQCK